ncbi:hypothetical protein ACIA8C_04320 [Nocardia sp. NPDC051321]|uniref:hypothetical protein n=1 Tax=Nocardia sp. NPDC051321 TaxID=3364323 RepID=UPI0037B4DA5C
MSRPYRIGSGAVGNCAEYMLWNVDEIVAVAFDGHPPPYEDLATNHNGLFET